MSLTVRLTCGSVSFCFGGIVTTTCTSVGTEVKGTGYRGSEGLTSGIVQ